MIDIVIPSAGRVADLLRLLESLHRCCPRTLLERVRSITVTDDRPPPELAAELARRFPSVRYVHGPARGPAANRNQGARQGDAPWLLFLDDDCYVESDLLAAYLARADAVLGAVVLEGAIHPVGPRPDGNHHAPLNLEGGLLWSCNLMLRRDLFERLGGFDEEFPFACMEDVDLRERLRAAAARVEFVPAAVVFHPWRSVGEREISRSLISHAIYTHKHPEWIVDWDLLRALRMLAGRLRLYRHGRVGTIPWRRWRAVAYDLAAPFALLAVVRVGPLRRALWQRWRNPMPRIRS